MSSKQSQTQPPNVNLEALVRAALEGDAREGITRLLQKVAELTGSFGCALWREATRRSGPAKHFTLLASWFDAEQSYLGIHTLPFKGTIVGKAAVSRSGSATDNRLAANRNPNCNLKFLQSHNIDKVAAHRLTFLSKRTGVLTLYRRRGVPNEADYSGHDLTQLSAITDLLPYLYSGARQKAAFNLLKEVESLLRHASESLPSPRKRQSLLASVGAALAKTFHSVETSIFVEDRKMPDTYVCAYTSEGPAHDKVMASRYTPSSRSGFTALSLYSGTPLRVHDIQQPKAEEEFLKRKYPNFGGHKTTGVSALANDYLGRPDPPPPQSLMVAPLIANSRSLGFVRCWVAETGPAYYSSDDLDLLAMVADSVSRTLFAWRQLERVKDQQKREKRAFHALARGGYRIGRIRRGVVSGDIFLATLAIVEQVIPNATVNSIRLRRPETDDLYFYAYPARDPFLSPQRLADEMKKSFSLTGDSLAAQVVAIKKPRHFKHLDQKPIKGYGEIFPGIKEIIVAPIIVGDRVEGVLDLRTRSRDGFPVNAMGLASTICNLLGMQIVAQEAEAEKSRARHEAQIAEVRANVEKVNNERNMRHAFEDVSHQIKSPLAEAFRRIQLVRERAESLPLSADLDVIAGLLHRSELTAKLIGFFERLAKGERLAVTGTPLTAVELVKIANQICENQRPRISTARDIRIELDSDSFHRHAPSTLNADPELLSHALSNLVDNAVKYSYSGTTIQIFASSSRDNSFIVSVVNKGIPILPHEVSLTIKRNWRGEQAQSVTGEGNGLGLWIVSNIMRAHGGDLQVLPTRAADQLTEMRLMFRLS